MAGAQIARLLLDKAGLAHVTVKEVQGFMADGFDIASSTIRLSSDHYRSNSVAAVCIAAHEVGHARQMRNMDGHTGFTWLNPRTAILLIQLAVWGAVLGGVMVIVGLLAQWQAMASFGTVFLLWAVGCSLLTLPIEINASRVALGMLRSEADLTESELAEARIVLRAAAWAYVATAGTALVHVLRDVVRRERN